MTEITQSFWRGFWRGQRIFWLLLWQSIPLIIVWGCYLLPFGALGLIRLIGVRVGPFDLPVAEFYAVPGPRWWDWLWAGWNGHALPCAIVLRENCLDYSASVKHEMRHCAQWAVLGPLFVPAYLACAVVFGYHENPFERDARRAEEV